jgi:hypothetical protein
MKKRTWITLITIVIVFIGINCVLWILIPTLRHSKWGAGITGLVTALAILIIFSIFRKKQSK